MTTAVYPCRRTFSMASLGQLNDRCDSMFAELDLDDIDESVLQEFVRLTAIRREQESILIDYAKRQISRGY